MKSRTTRLGNGQQVTQSTKKRFTSLGSSLLVIAAFAGSACEESEDLDVQNEEELEFGIALEELGTNVATCTAAVVDTDFVAATKVLNLTVLTATDAVVSVVGGKIKVNGWQCKTTGTNVELTSTNVNKINIGAAGTSKIVLDLLPGTFGNIFGTTGGITITGGAGLSVGVRGTAAANAFKMAQEGASAAGPFYMELTGNAQADVKIVGNPDLISFALGDGADSFTAQGQVLTTSVLGGSGTTGDVATEAVTVFGGLGNDTLKGGLMDDTLNGGEGNDVFQMSALAVDDGGDIYIGGAGTDTVDYSGRTNAVNVSIAPTYDNGWVEGVNIFNFTVDITETLNYSIGGVAGTPVTFAAAVTGESAILGVLNNGVGGLVGATASVNDRGELVIKKSGAAGAIAITGGTAGLFVGTPSNNGVAALATDPDDGLTGEADDVRADVENITGGTAGDTLSGSILSNTITGGAGADDISGGSPNADCLLDVDVLNGGDGDDTFRMGRLTNCGDAVDGGLGTDKVNYEMRAVGVIVDIDASADDGEALELDTIKVGAEIILGGEGDDSITGGVGNDELHGGLGADTLNGGAGADTIVGGPGNDSLFGGAGEDYFNEKDVVDTLFVKLHLPNIGADLINGAGDTDTCDYGRTSVAAMTVTLCAAPAILTATGNCADGGADTADGDDITNCENFIGGAGPDTITGSTGDDRIEGGAGADSIIGGAGNDALFGDADNDNLDGGDGDDSLDGGTGTNTASCGAGDDIITLATNADLTCEI
jgi:Ca2+-binding RTX toxin-like protein